jgi:hypothetical protein
VKGGTKFGLWGALNTAKGLTAETNVLSALENEKPKWFKSAHKSTKKEDHNGFDITVFSYDRDGHIWEVPIQIKSSVKGLMEHIAQRRKLKGKFIPCIVVSINETDKAIVQKVKSAIKLFIEGKEKFKQRQKRLEKKNKQNQNLE